MKRILGFTALFLFLLIVSACSKQEELIKKEELTRIDVQKTNENSDIAITDKTTIKTINNSLDNAKWTPNVKAEMARKEDLFITLFHTFDKNMPEKLSEYRVWFNTDDTATIISDNSKQGFGALDKNNTEALKSALLKDGEEKKSKEITVYKMDIETKQIVISDKVEIKTINNAIKDAIKQPGIVDMADPQYKINIGDEIYFLWLTRSDGTIGTIMNFKDTHTIYTLSENMTKELKDILLKDN